jgi:hypothetical protein
MRHLWLAATGDGYSVDMQTSFPEGFQVTVYSPCFTEPAPGPSSS